MVEQPEIGTNTTYLVDFIKITLLPKLLDFNEIRALYLDKGRSTAQIAKEYEVAKSVIVGLLNRAGIRPGRENSNAAAKELGRRGYKNRSGGTNWDHSTVRSIFKRWKEKL